MPTILDKLKGAAPEVNADDAIAQLAAANQKSDALDTKGIALLKEQAELEDKIGRTSDDAGAKKLLDRIDAIKKERVVNDARKSVAAKERADADANLRKARGQDRIKTIKKLLAARTDGAVKITKGSALMNEGWGAIHDANEALVAFAGSDLSANGGYGGTLLSRQDLKSKVEQELTRISAPAPLDGRATPALPGSRTLALVGSPQSLKSFADEVEAANGYLLRKAANIPATPAPAPVAVERKADAAPVEETMPEGPVVSAEQVIASLGRRRLE